MQSPEDGQVVVQEEASVQVCWQSPPGQVRAQDELESQTYWPSPACGSSLQVTPEAQVQVVPLQT